MSNITTFGGANLPSVQSLSGALRSIQSEVAPGGTVILKMDKTGHWVFGADQTEVEDGSLWAANPFSFVHGYIAWGNGEVLAEKLVPVSEPLPELEPAPSGATHRRVDRGTGSLHGSGPHCSHVRCRSSTI